MSHHDSVTMEVDYDPFAGPAIAATAPSTEPQREIWTATRMGEDASLAFNESISLRFRGSLDGDAMRGACSELILRHEALRSTFSEDGLVLCVSAPFEPELVFEDWSGFTPEARDGRWRELLARHVETPFDLARGPLFRIQLVKFASDEHRLVFTGHHIVVDGWSTAVIVQDLAGLYNARRGVGTPLPAADSFTAYSRELANADPRQQAADEAYWLQQFAGEIPVLELPTDRPRPALKTYPALREDVVFDAELVSAVRRMGAKCKASLFATLLGGFVALLHRLTGQEDCVIGIPAAGQSVSGHDKLVGHCVNTLPLRARPHGKQPFSELLGQVRTTLLDAYDHQTYTFGTLLKKLPLPRDPSRPPLVSIAFNVERGLSDESMGFESLSTECVVNPRHFENFDLFLNCIELAGSVKLECQYNTDLFDTATIRRWLEAYRLLLADAAGRPALELGQLSIMSEAERRQLIDAFNAGADSPLPKSCVHVLFEQIVQSTPDAPALIFEGGQLSYAELDARANRLARRLQQCGIGPDDRVALCLERTPELIVALLAILKAGGAYLPLEPNYPALRMQFMLDDAKPKAIITQELLRAKLPPYACPLVSVDAEASAIAELSDSKVVSGATPENLAYVIYTSGSTGKPKGVLVPHRAIDRLVRQATYAEFGPDRCFLQAAPVAFDASTFEIWGALLNGARLVLYPEQVPTARGIGRAIEQYGVTTMWLTAALFNAIIDEDPSQLSGLEELLTGGEALSVPHVRRALEKLPKLRLINGYGPTETTTFATTYPIPRPLAANVQAMPIGRGIRETRLYVLDGNVNPVPVGVIGELYIGGEGVAHGYLERPELTAERFVADPFRPGLRLYKTGDLVRFRSDGVLEFFGRADQQVKIRGFRIELGEIEESLGQHPDVRQVAVVLREDRAGDKRLVAYTVAESERTPSADELRDHLKRLLPEYMLPSNFVALDALPLTSSGKIDRRALPAPQTGASDEEFVAPRTPTETLLSELWKAALQVGRVSVHDDFFALGGHSLLASRILSRLRRDHGIELSFRKIFEAPTVARLAELIDGSPVNERRAPEQPIVRRPHDAKVPLSMIQERHWMLEELQPAQRFVHSVRGTWQLDGDLDVELFQKALNEIAQRHEVLRMKIVRAEAQLFQHFAPQVDLTIREVDMRKLPAAERELAVVTEIEALHKQPFDLLEGPLFRSTLFRIEDQRYVYFTLRHSMVWDGWSYDVFLKELCGLYSALKSGHAVALPELPIGYGDYALWYREWLKGPELARQVEFWRQHLGQDVLEVRLPADRPRPLQMTHAGGNEKTSFTKAESEALSALARTTSGTLFTVLFAAYVALLQRYTAQREMLVGTPVRGRNRPELENLIGNFVNTLALRIQVEPEWSFSELVAKVRDLTLDAFSNEDLPLELLGDRPPVVQVLFSLQDARERPRRAADVVVSQLYRPLPVASNDLMLWIMDYGDQLLGVINYSTELFEPANIQRFLKNYTRIVRHVIQDPSCKLSELPLLDAEDLQELANYGKARAIADSTGLVHVALERHARENPDGRAVIQGEEVHSFADLNRSANRIASRLRALGIGRGSVIAVVLPPSFELCAAVYGVLKCGAVVTTLDPAFPKQRNAALLAAARPNVVITQELLRGDLPLLSDPVLCLDSERAALEEQSSADAPVLDLDPRKTAAWLVFQPAENERGRGPGSNETANERGRGPASNETEQPTLVSHAGLLCTCVGIGTELGLGKAGLVTVLRSPLRESAPIELVLGPSVGAVTLLPRDDEAAELASVIERGDVETAVCDAEVWGALIASGWAGRPTLTAIVLGRLQETLAESMLPLVKQLFSVHVVPEAGLGAFVQRVEAPADVRAVGTPLGSTRAAVLDRGHRPVPVGVHGKLYLSNAAGRGSVASRPDLESSHWVELKAPGVFEGFAIETRESARWSERGQLELCGREDDSIVVSGLRFYPNEVARVLERHPAVAAAAAMLREAGPGDLQLVAYFAAKPGASFTETEYRRLLRSELPEAMIPRVFVELLELPRTVDGKLDSSVLPSPWSSIARTEYVAPRSDFERILAELWQEALKLPRVSVYDNFFDLGGHSLLCFKVIVRLEAKTGKRLNPRVMLLNSLEQIAATLSEEPSAPAPSQQSATANDSGLASRMLRKIGNILRGP